MKKKSKEQEDKKNYHFEKLTPKSDTDIDVYDQALDFVFKNDDIKNVAISGAYGSGKSNPRCLEKERSVYYGYIYSKAFQSTDS